MAYDPKLGYDPDIFGAAPVGAGYDESIFPKAAQTPKVEAPKEKSGLQSALDIANAVASGFNRAFVSRAGLPFNPVDAAANAIDLGKAALGAPYVAVTGKPPPSWLEVGDRGAVPGSGPWLVNKARQTQLGRAALDPSDPSFEGGLLQAAGGGAGYGGRGNLLTGAASSTAGQFVADATGSNALGVAAGLAPMAARQGAIQLGQKIATPSDPRRAELARIAVNDEGIPLSVADTTSSKFVKTMRSIMDETPLLSLMGDKQRTARNEGLNRAAGRTMGINEDTIPAERFMAGKDAIGQRLNKIWENNALRVDGRFVTELDKVTARAAEKLLPDQAAQVAKLKDALLSQVQIAEGKGVSIPGGWVNNFQSELRMMAEGEKGLHKQVLNDMRQTVLRGFNRSVTGKEAADLSEARSQWGAAKTLEPLLTKSEAGVAGRIGGDVPAGLLPGAVASQYAGRVDRSPFSAVSPIAGNFMVDRVPQTGGSQRAMLQNIATGGAIPTALGLTGLLGSIPAATVGGAAAGGLQYLLTNPGIARKLLDPNTGRMGANDWSLLSNMPGLLGQ